MKHQQCDLKISIIIPIYNVEEYIDECLQSVYAQTYSNLEVILVNDCTPDNSMDIAQNAITLLQEKFSVTVHNHSVNGGLSAARNSGLNVASGDYVYFLDSDDILFPNTIEKLVAVRQENDDFVMGNFIRSNAKMASPIFEMKLSDNQVVFESFIENKWDVIACNKLIRTDFLKENGLCFVPGLLHEDELFSFHLALHADSITIVNEVTYWYRMRDGAITSYYSERNANAMLDVIQKQILLFERRDTSKVERHKFFKFVVQKCYIILTMIFLNDLSNQSDMLIEIKRLLGKNRKLKKQKGFISFKEFLISTPRWVIMVYMKLLMLKKYFEKKG